MFPLMRLSERNIKLKPWKVLSNLLVKIGQVFVCVGSYVYVARDEWAYKHGTHVNIDKTKSNENNHIWTI